MKSSLKEHVNSDGRVKIEELDYTFLAEESINGDFALNWIQTFEGKKYLLKTLVTDEHKVTSDQYIEGRKFQKCEISSILMPFILRQLGIETAYYYLGRYKDKDIIFTPSFLSEDEKLISGEDVMPENKSRVTDIYEILKVIKKKINKKIREEFLIQTMAAKFINITDELNKNWGIIHNKKTNEVRLTPMYDFDFSGPNAPDFHRRYIGDLTSYDLNSFIAEFRHVDAVREFLSRVVSNFDLEAAFKACEEETMVVIPDIYKNQYRDFFAWNLNQIKKGLEAKRGLFR